MFSGVGWSLFRVHNTFTYTINTATLMPVWYNIHSVYTPLSGNTGSSILPLVVTRFEENMCMGWIV